MQDSVDACRQNPAGLAAQVAADELGPRGDGVGVPGGQVVEHHDAVAGLQEVGGDDTADVAGAAGDEQLHALVLPHAGCASDSLGRGRR